MKVLILLEELYSGKISDDEAASGLAELVSQGQGILPPDASADCSESLGTFQSGAKGHGEGHHTPPGGTSGLGATWAASSAGSFVMDDPARLMRLINRSAHVRGTITEAGAAASHSFLAGGPSSRGAPFWPSSTAKVAPEASLKSIASCVTVESVPDTAKDNSKSIPVAQHTNTGLKSVKSSSKAPAFVSNSSLDAPRANTGHPLTGDQHPQRCLTTAVTIGRKGYDDLGAKNSSSSSLALGAVAGDLLSSISGAAATSLIAGRTTAGGAEAPSRQRTKRVGSAKMHQGMIQDTSFDDGFGSRDQNDAHMAVALLATLQPTSRS